MNEDNVIMKIIEKAKEYGCNVLLDECLCKHTTFKIGGPCKAFISINSSESLSKLIKIADEESYPYFVLGKGSNLLFDDRGFNGVVFHLGADFSGIRLIDDTTIQAEAGCSLMNVCRFAYENGLSGLEFAFGIPGSVGGAVYMNAGAYGGEIKDVLVSAKAFDKKNVTEFNAEDMDLSYRHSIFQENGCIITEAVFRLDKKDKVEIKALMDDYLNRRKEKQPLEFPNGGSTFKRPTGQFAGKLIQDSGLRGFSVGGAEVSSKHCGFVINKGNATFEDVTGLIKKVQETVKEKTGFFLECEVEIVNYNDEIK